MPIDARIALGVQAPQIDDPLTAQTKRLQLSDLMGRNQLQQYQLQGAQQQFQRQQQLRSLLGGLPSTTTDDQRVHALQGGGYFDEADKLQSGVLTRDKTRAEIGKTGADTAKEQFALQKQKMDAATSVISSVLAANPNPTHQDIYQAISRAAAQYGLSPEDQSNMVRGLPGDQAKLRPWLVSKGMELMTAQDRMKALTPQLKPIDNGQQTQFVDENAITNPNPAPVQMQAKPGELLTAATARRGQDLTDARARETNAAVVGKPFEVTDPNTGQPVLVRQDRAGTVSPVPGFQPKGMGATKLTEDQGKATGWLAQATNAFGNMQKAMTSSPDASRPGFPDVVGKVPGLGGAANMMRGADRQNFMQGASSLSEALLRAATGAGVNRDEAAQKVQELTPVFGDSEETIQQKMAAIPVYIESLKVRAGPGSKQIPGIFERATAPKPPAGGWSIKKLE